MTSGCGSQSWHHAYGDEAARRRRLAELPAKYRLLGADHIDRNASVLDLCCGNGEGLETLYALGFRNLTGLDATISPHIENDPRFAIVAGDALTTDLPSRFNWITFVHAMHHFETADRAIALLERCYTMLEPGGRLSIIDFPNSPQIQAAFWFFRRKPLLVTPYLRNFGALIEEEWPFLRGYLPQFSKIHRWLHSGKMTVEVDHRALFYFYLTLRKD